MATLEELEAQRALVTKQIKAMRGQARAQAVAEIHRLLGEHGLSVSDVAAASAKRSEAAKGSTRKVAPKYQDPATGQTWSGRGLKPRWLVAAIAGGRRAEDFLI